MQSDVQAGTPLDSVLRPFYQDVQKGLYLPDISKTLDEKNGTRGGVVAASDFPGGSPLVSRELDKVLVWIKKLHLFRLFMCHENFRLEVTLLTLKAGLGRKKS